MLKIKEARELRGLSQKELADALKIKPTTFNGYETGAHDPKSEVLKLIAQECQVSIDFLLGITDIPNQQIANVNSSAAYENLRGTSSFEKELIKKYRRLNDNGKDRLDSYMDDLLTIDKYKASSPKPILLAGAARTNDGDYSKREEPTTEEEQKAMLKRLQEAHDEAEDNIY